MPRLAIVVNEERDADDDNRDHRAECDGVVKDGCGEEEGEGHGSADSKGARDVILIPAHEHEHERNGVERARGVGARTGCAGGGLAGEGGAVGC